MSRTTKTTKYAARCGNRHLGKSGTNVYSFEVERIRLFDSVVDAAIAGGDPDIFTYPENLKVIRVEVETIPGETTHTLSEDLRLENPTDRYVIASDSGELVAEKRALFANWTRTISKAAQFVTEAAAINFIRTAHLEESFQSADCMTAVRRVISTTAPDTTRITLGAPVE